MANHVAIMPARASQAKDVVRQTLTEQVQVIRLP
jgi:hypothetical protein